MTDAIMSAYPGTRVSVTLADVAGKADRKLLSVNRARTWRSVASCEACGLRAGCQAPVPFHGPETGAQGAMRPSMVVLGEAPGPDEDRQRQPFVGKSGRLLRAMMDKAGIDVERVMFANAVSCWPNDNGRRTRTPTADEMIACWGNAMNQLAASDCEYVLLVGGTALHAWRMDLAISEVHGQVFVWDGRYVVMPIYHPSYILRTRMYKTATVEDLERWKWLTHEQESLSALGIKCIRCAEYVYDYDPDGVPYCEVHMEKGVKAWKKERDRRAKWTASSRSGNGSSQSLMDM